jgi:hypothetical protein
MLAPIFVVGLGLERFFRTRGRLGAGLKPAA